MQQHLLFDCPGICEPFLPCFLHSFYILVYICTVYTKLFVINIITGSFSLHDCLQSPCCQATWVTQIESGHNSKIIGGMPWIFLTRYSVHEIFIYCSQIFIFTNFQYLLIFILHLYSPGLSILYGFPKSVYLLPSLLIIFQTPCLVFLQCGSHLFCRGVYHLYSI